MVHSFSLCRRHQNVCMTLIVVLNTGYYLATEIFICQTSNSKIWYKVSTLCRVCVFYMKGHITRLSRLDQIGLLLASSFGYCKCISGPISISAMGLCCLRKGFQITKPRLFLESFYVRQKVIPYQNRSFSQHRDSKC